MHKNQLIRTCPLLSWLLWTICKSIGFCSEDAYDYNRNRDPNRKRFGCKTNPLHIFVSFLFIAVAFCWFTLRNVCISTFFFLYLCFFDSVSSVLFQSHLPVRWCLIGRRRRREKNGVSFISSHLESTRVRLIYESTVSQTIYTNQWIIVLPSFADCSRFYFIPLQMFWTWIVQWLFSA